MDVMDGEKLATLADYLLVDETNLRHPKRPVHDSPGRRRTISRTELLQLLHPQTL